jgi:NAD+ kinase
MKKSQFARIGIMGKPQQPELQATLEVLVQFLKTFSIQIVLESHCHALLSESIAHYDADEIGKHIDLLIVIGGDGSLLKAARSVVKQGTPVLGINRGRLGFLTDILPQTIEEQLGPVLTGHYRKEDRHLLQTKIIRDGQIISESIALNDVVLYSGDIARMIEFEVYIDDTFVYKQRSDGLITATPTGSTAYALSGGGPILHPGLEALVLVPMHPHTLSSRPIVVKNQSHIKLHITPETQLEPRVSCDGQIHFTVKANDEIHIERYAKCLHLIHPNEYDYFNVLRNKLGWASGN